MRKLFIPLLLLVIAATLVVAGCGDDDDSSSDAGSTTAAATAASTADLGLKEDGVLLVGSDIPYAPFEYTEPGSDEVIGFDVDVVTAVAERMGITDVQFQKQSFDTIFIATKQGRFDMAASSITITPEREEVVSFSDPYFSANQSIMIRADEDDPALTGLSGDLTRQEALDALAGQKIGVQRGTTGADLALEAPDAEVSQFQLVDDAFNALAQGRVDAVVNDFAISADAAKAKPQLEVVAQIVTDESYGFAFPQESTALLEAFNAGLAEIKADGTYDQIYEEWFGTAPPSE